MNRLDYISLTFFIQAVLLLMTFPLSHARNFSCYSCNSFTDSNCGMLDFTGVGIPKVSCEFNRCETSTAYNSVTNTYETVSRGCATQYGSSGCMFDPSYMGIYTCSQACTDSNCNGVQPVKNVACYSCRDCDVISNTTKTLTCPYSCLASAVSDSDTGIVTHTDRSCGPFPVHTSTLYVPISLNRWTGVYQCSISDFCNEDSVINPRRVTQTVQPTTRIPVATVFSSTYISRYNGGFSLHLSFLLFLCRLFF